MFIRLNKKGQSTLEYAVVIGVVAAALLAINIYMKRAKEGRLRSSVDQIGEQFDSHKTKVYSKEESTGKTVEITSGGATETYSDGTHGSTQDITKVKSTEEVGPWVEQPIKIDQ